MEDRYNCAYCKYHTPAFAEAIDHNIIFHPSNVLKIKKLIIKDDNSKALQTKNFQVVPDDLAENKKFIHSNANKETITISNFKYDNSSPVSKKARHTSTPVKGRLTSKENSETEGDVADSLSDIKSSDSDGESDLSLSFMNLSLDTQNSEEINSELEVLISLLPKVLDNLRSTGHLDTFMNFNKLLAENKFPVDNIAYLLFLDIVNWYSLDSSFKMRYSEDVKQFWRIGSKLFKGKFLKFMGGPKHTGQQYKKGNYKPMESEINFAVPDRKILEQIKSPVNITNPGLIVEMIDAVANFDPSQIQTFKIFVDGKKINAGVQGQTLGDVNLWGFEESPTLKEGAERLNIELEKVEHLKSIIEYAEIKEFRDVADISEDIKIKLVIEMKDIVCMLTNRLKELRELKVRRELGLDKLMSQVVGDWRNSRLSFAISAVKSGLYEIDACLSNLLQTIDSLCEMIAYCNGSYSTFVKTSQVLMQYQENFMRLSGIEDPSKLEGELNNSKLKNVKQRSDAWIAVRKLASATGSTCYKALGFDGLRKQQEHYNSTICNIPSKEPDPETKKRMQHGSDNELNAIATLVSKVLPVFFPDTVFVEKGCYVLPQKNAEIFIVSPDGSVRNTVNGNVDTVQNPTFGIEIKCPYPGNMYKTPGQYKLPVYYVLQILSEMVAMEVDKLLFVSYSAESTVISIAEFDNTLWQKIWTVFLDIYSDENPKYPKTLHSAVRKLHGDLKTYVVDKIQLLCEVPSVTAIQCEHLSDSSNGPYLNGHSTDHVNNNPRFAISSLQCCLHKARECIQFSYQLCRLRSNEVLVFLLADLDRMNKGEQQHASPVAFAMKGYCMKSIVMRHMLEMVLHECFQRGLYIPVISFDGQWYNLVVRDRNQTPLTILQLQKDTFQEAKKEPKSKIVRRIFAANVVQEKDVVGLLSKVSLHISADRYGCIHGPIVVGGILDGEIFKPSIHITNVIKSEVEKSNKTREKNKQKRLDQTNMSETENVEITDFILDSLPDHIFASLDNTTIEEIRGIEAKVSSKFLIDSRLPQHNDEYLDGLEESISVGDEVVHGENVSRILIDANSDVDMAVDADSDVDMPVDTTRNTSDDIELQSSINDLIMDDSVYLGMLTSLKGSKDSSRWNSTELHEFKSNFVSKDKINTSFLKGKYRFV